MTTPSHAELRSTYYIAEMLEMLIGKAVQLKEVPPFRIARDPAYIATYNTQEGVLSGLFLCDLPFAAATGGALSLVPVPEVQASIKNKALSETLAANFHEIVNICSRLYTTPRTPRVILDKVFTYPCRLERDLVQYMAKPEIRVDLHAKIPGYGEGRFSLLAT